MADACQSPHADDASSSKKLSKSHCLFVCVSLLGLVVCLGCSGQLSTSSHPPHTLFFSFAGFSPDLSNSDGLVQEQFKVISGNPNTGQRLVVVVQDEDAPLPGVPPSLYDSALLFPVTTKRTNPKSEGIRLHNALTQLARSSARVDVWAVGAAGLIVRYAVERADSQAPPVSAVVLIDTPHRGLSPSGWPNWQGSGSILTELPHYIVPGSSFLLELNRTPAANLERIHYVNVWRELQSPLPRATVMSLPRPAVLIVLHTSNDSLWSALDSQVIAVRRIAEGGLLNVADTEGPTLREQEISHRAPRLLNVAAPSFASLIDNSVSELADVSPSWLAYNDTALSASSTRGPPRDPFAGMTDAVSVGYDAATHRLVITGFQDFSRDPLNSDYFFSALDSFQHAYPAISIDPPTATDPAGQAPVRYLGSTSGTSLGGLMFEADRAMKTLALGRDNITNTPVGSDIPGYRSIASAQSTEPSYGESMWRLWFEPARWHARTQGPFNAIIDARLRCRWERMSPTYAPSQAVINFTDSLSTRLHQYSLEQPSFGQLNQASVLVAMARWTYEANLDVAQGARPSKASFATPAHTPLIEVRNQTVSGPYRVTQVIQGGVTLGPPLRRVRDESSQAGHLMAAALQSIPKLQQGIATQLTLPPTHRTKNPPPPPYRPRPPTVSWGYNDNGYLLTAVSFSAQQRDPRRTIGAPNSSDDLSAPAFSSEQRLAQDLPNLQPAITDVFVDDALDPPQVTLRGLRFGSKGLALFNGNPLSILKWTAQEVTISFPLAAQAGTLVLRSADRDSNAIEFIPAPGPARAEPPRITVTNRTSYSLHVEIHPAQRGSSRSLDLAPGLTSSTKVLPGRYTITAQASGVMILGGTKTEEKMYERGYTYSLIYEASSFSLGKLVVNNNTGSEMSLTVGGQVVRLPPGQQSTVQLPFGNHKVLVNTRCGSEVTNQIISPNRVPELSYECRRVFR